MCAPEKNKEKNEIEESRSREGRHRDVAVKEKKKIVREIERDMQKKIEMKKGREGGSK